MVAKQGQGPLDGLAQDRDRREAPAEQLGGIRMIEALAAPFRSVRFIPTGGVNTGNLSDYLAHPAVLAVGGTWMVAPDLLAAGRWDEVAARTAAAVAVARPAPGA